MEKSEKRRQARLQGRHNAGVQKPNSVFEKQQGMAREAPEQPNDAVNHSVAKTMEIVNDIDKNEEIDYQEMRIVNNSERFRRGNNRGSKRSQKHFSDQRQRGNGRSFNNQNSPIFSDERVDIVSRQSFTNDVNPSVAHPVETSSAIVKNQEMGFQKTRVVTSSERFRNGNSRGRKRFERYETNIKRKDAGKSWNNESQIVAEGGVDETVQCLNGLSVNTDAPANASLTSVETRKFKDATKSNIRRNNRYAVAQSSNNRIDYYAYTNKQSYNYDHQSNNNLRDRNENRHVRNRPSFHTTHYSIDESAFKEASTYNNESRKEIQRSVSFNSYRANRELTKDSSNNISEINGDYQRRNLGSSNRFVYEETHQAENIVQKIKKPAVLKITGWHTMIQHNPDEKESILYFKPDFLGEEERDYYYHHLKKSISWQEKEIIIRGEKYVQPRLVAWYGPLEYSYSNSVLEPNCQFPPIILDIKKRIENILKEEQKNVTFNSVLLNMYRDGKDSVAWHSDDELSMGIHPTIASVSLGETRRFEMKRKQDQRADGTPQQDSEECVIYLTSGSLLVMDGAMQQYWLHRVPKEFHDRDCRINLTFRTVYPMKE